MHLIKKKTKEPKPQTKKEVKVLNRLKQHIQTYKWQYCATLLLLLTFYFAIQLQQKINYANYLETKQSKNDYLIALTKSNKEITASDVLNKLIYNDDTKENIKQAIIQNIAIKEYTNSVTEKQINEQLLNAYIDTNTTAKEYYKLTQTTKKEKVKEITEQLAILNALTAYTTVDNQILAQVKKNYRPNGTFLIAIFNSKDNAEKFRTNLISKQKANYTLNEQTVTNLMLQANCLNTKYIKQTFGYYNDRYKLSVNDQIWQTPIHQPSIVIDNEETNVLYHKYYVVFPLQKDDVVKKPSKLQNREMTTIAKRLQLNQSKTLDKVKNKILNDSGMQYEQTFQEIVK